MYSRSAHIFSRSSRKVFENNTAAGTEEKQQCFSFFVSTYFARSAGCRPSRRRWHKSCPGHRRGTTMFLFFCIHIFRKECRLSVEPTPMAQVLSRAHDKEETFSGLFFLFLNIGVGVSFFFIFAVSDYLEYVMQVTISVLLLQRDSFSCVWMNTL